MFLLTRKLAAFIPSCLATKIWENLSMKKNFKRKFLEEQNANNSLLLSNLANENNEIKKENKKLKMEVVLLERLCEMHSNTIEVLQINYANKQNRNKELQEAIKILENFIKQNSNKDELINQINNNNNYQNKFEEIDNDEDTSVSPLGVDNNEFIDIIN